MTPEKQKITVRSLLCLLIVGCILLPATTSAQNSNRSTGMQAIVSIIDSLEAINVDLTAKLRTSDSLLDVEKLTTAELRDQVLVLEEYKKKLEATKTDVEDENLKLNQSNRILIIFNSVVAVLLVITLVFVIRRAGRKTLSVHTAIKPEENRSSPGNPSTASNKFASFEDKLAQLEKLGSLKEKGILSDEEFQSEKQRILGK